MKNVTRALAAALAVSGMVASGAFAQQVIYASPATTTTVTTITTPQPVLASASGVVAGYDPRINIVAFTDGRLVQVSGKSAILVNGHPTPREMLAPGMPVMISAVNPVVTRDGRTAVLNQGFFDAGTGASATWDAKFAGYEGDTSNAAMQPQAGN